MRWFGYVTNKLYSKQSKIKEINECCFLIPDEKAKDKDYLEQLAKEAAKCCRDCETMQCIQREKRE